MPKRYAWTVATHTAAEIGLLMSVALGLQLLQNFVLIPIGEMWERRYGPAMAELGMSTAPWFLDSAARQYWRFSSFAIWLSFGFLASFVLHLPSLWKKRVQLARAFRPLGEDWYGKQARPMWFPAGWFFPLLWIPVKCIRAVGHSVMWEKTGRSFVGVPSVLAVASFVAANMWNQVVFVQHDLLGGLAVLGMQFVLMLSSLLYALREVPSVAKVFAPYTITLCVSVFLNLTLYLYNPSHQPTKKTA